MNYPQKHYNIINDNWIVLEGKEKKKMLCKCYMHSILESMNFDKMAEASYTDRQVSQETKDKITKKYEELFCDIIEAITPLYTQIYTYEELTSLVKFTCSPIGKSILKKQSFSTGELYNIIRTKTSTLSDEIYDMIHEDELKNTVNTINVTIINKGDDIPKTYLSII